MSRPLIPYAIFLKDNKFKLFCKKFIEYFGGDHIKWDGDVQMAKVTLTPNGKPKQTYIKNKNRCQQLHDRYLSALHQIKQSVTKTTQSPATFVDVEKNMRNWFCNGQQKHHKHNSDNSDNSDISGMSINF